MLKKKICFASNTHIHISIHSFIHSVNPSIFSSKCTCLTYIIYTSSQFTTSDQTTHLSIFVPCLWEWPVSDASQEGGGKKSNNRKNALFKQALDTHSLVRIVLYNLLFSYSFIFFFPCTFLSHIKLKIITQMPFGYSVKYFGNLTIYYAPFFHSSFFEIYLCWKFHCVFRNTFLRGKKNLNDKESFFISLVHNHNYASHHFLIGCVVLSEAVIHLPENVLTITSAYHYQKFIRNGVNRGLRLIRVNIGKIFLSYK